MKIRGFGRNLNLLLASYFLSLFAYGGLYWLLSNLYLLRLGYDVQFVGIINGVGYLVYALLSYPAGHLVSRWGLKRSLLVGTLLSALFLAGFTLVESFPREIRPLLFVGTMLAGGTGYALYLACIAPASMEARPERRAAALSASSFASLAGSSLGSLAAGLIVGPFGRLLGASDGSPAPFRLGLALTAVVQLGAVACVAFMRRETPTSPAAQASREASAAPAARLSPPLFAVLFSIGLLGSLLGVAVGNFFNMHLDQTFHVPTESIGVALAVVKAVPLGGYVLAPFLVKRLGAFPTALVSMISACLAAASIGLASGWVVAAGGYALMSFLGALGGPASSLLYQEAVPKEARPVVAGTQNAASGLASTATLFAGGFLIASLGYGRFFLLGLALNAVSIAIFAAWFSAPERRKPATAATVPANRA